MTDTSKPFRVAAGIQWRTAFSLLLVVLVMDAVIRDSIVSDPCPYYSMQMLFSCPFITKLISRNPCKNDVIVACKLWICPKLRNWSTSSQLIVKCTMKLLHTWNLQEYAFRNCRGVALIQLTPHIQNLLPRYTPCRPLTMNQVWNEDICSWCLVDDNSRLKLMCRSKMKNYPKVTNEGDFKISPLHPHHEWEK